jgi:hypothetical protein
MNTDEDGERSGGISAETQGGGAAQISRQQFVGLGEHNKKNKDLLKPSDLFFFSLTGGLSDADFTSGALKQCLRFELNIATINTRAGWSTLKTSHSAIILCILASPKMMMW